jgi:GntR family transcriptional regulator, transcriptional repressor for pyruvate dehydrogenase complex
MCDENWGWTAARVKNIIFHIFREERGGMAVHSLFKDATWEPVAGGSATLSSQIVAYVREALFDKTLKPGDFLGTEKDIAARFGVSRIVARDAFRTLQALGVIAIKVGAGGGARIAHGDPRQFADALAIQLGLAGISVREILDAQRAVEGMAAELAAEHATLANLSRLKGLLAEAAACISDVTAYTQSSLRFHLAVAEASQNRVLLAQLQSLQYVSWPARNKTLTRPVARHILEVHGQLVDLIEARDAPAARRLMDDHVKMIRARRVAERMPRAAAGDADCC